MRNVGASIKAKLKSAARQKGVSMEFMLIRYANERLLGRLAASEWSEKFCLKGGMLLPVFNDGEMYRPTSDLDLSGLDEGNLDVLKQMISELSDMKPKSEGGVLEYDDGITFLKDTIRARREVEGGADGGKVEFDAILDKSRIRMRVDAGFRSPITPGVQSGEYPCLFRDDKKAPMPQPKIKMYPPETMVAEKLHANAQFGSFNTRIRDYYDLLTLIGKFDFDDKILSEAISKTFAKAGREVPEDWPGLSLEFAAENEGRWAQFNKNTNLKEEMPPLSDVVTSIYSRLEVPIGLARNSSGHALQG